MVVWYVATHQAKRLLEAIPLQPVREKCELLQQETTPSAQKGIGSGSPRVDEELDKVDEPRLLSLVTYIAGSGLVSTRLSPIMVPPTCYWEHCIVR